jgi:hypothetical protein
MKDLDHQMRLYQLSAMFLAIRAVEFAWILLVFVTIGALVHFISRPVGETWGLRDAVYAGVVMLAWYYLGFQYLLVSALVIMAGWLTGRLKTLRGFVLFNLLTFVGHSLVVMLVILPGKISPTLSATWLFAVIFNCGVPILISNLRRSETNQT